MASEFHLEPITSKNSRLLALINNPYAVFGRPVPTGFKISPYFVSYPKEYASWVLSVLGEEEPSPVTDMFRDCCQFAYKGAQAVGAIVCCPMFDDQEQLIIYIMSLDVLKDYHRQGIGSLLLHHVFSFATRYEIAQFYVHVQTANQATLTFFETFGFEVTTTVPQDCSSIVLEDSMLLRKVISQAIPTNNPPPECSNPPSESAIYTNIQLKKIKRENRKYLNRLYQPFNVFSSDDDPALSCCPYRDFDVVKYNECIIPTIARDKEYEDFSKLAYVNKRFVGGIICKPMTDDGKVFIYIMTFGVLKADQKKGVGTKLLNHVMSLASKRNISEIYLHLQTKNKNAELFLRKFGFDISSRIPENCKAINLDDCTLFRKVTPKATISRFSERPTKSSSSMIGEASSSAQGGTESPIKSSSSMIGEASSSAQEGSIIGIGTVIVKHQANQANESFATSSGYSTGCQKFEIQSDCRPVYTRTFTRDVEDYFKMRESLVHDNIQRVCLLTSTDGKSLISYECVHAKLTTLLQYTIRGDIALSKNEPFQLPLHSEALAMQIITQIGSALDYLHSMNICHGRLTADDISLVFDSNFGVHQIQHVIVKLTLPEHEEILGDRYSLGRFVGSKAKDCQSLAALSLRLINSFSIQNPEFDILCEVLSASTKCSMKVLTTVPLYWRPSVKMESINLMAHRKLGVKIRFETLKWTNEYKDLIKILKVECPSPVREPSERKHIDYKNDLASFLLFQATVFAHYYQFSREAQLAFGIHKGDVLRRFQQFYPYLFVDIYTEAKSQNLLDKLMELKDM